MCADGRGGGRPRTDRSHRGHAGGLRGGGRGGRRALGAADRAPGRDGGGGSADLPPGPARAGRARTPASSARSAGAGRPGRSWPTPRCSGWWRWAEWRSAPAATAASSWRGAGRLLRRLGGGADRPHRPPGTLVLTCGLRRLRDHVVIQSGGILSPPCCPASSPILPSPYARLYVHSVRSLLAPLCSALRGVADDPLTVSLADARRPRWRCAAPLPRPLPPPVRW